MSPMEATQLEEAQLAEKNDQRSMKRKLERAKQYLADRGIAAMGPNSTFIYTDSKGRRHAPTEAGREGVLHPSSPDHADAGGKAVFS